MTNPTDKAILKALKNPSSSKDREQAAKLIRTPQVKAAFEFFCDNGRPPDLIIHLSSLVGARVLLSAEFLFLKYAESLATHTLDEVLPAMPSAKALDAWIEKQNDPSGAANGVRGIVRESPSKALQSVLALWFFERVVPNELQQGAETLFLMSESKPFVSQSALLTVALQRDKDGAFCAKLLELANQRDGTLASVLNSVGTDSMAMESFLAAFPKIVDSLAPDLAKQIPPLLFGSMASSEGAESRLLSAQMLKMAETMLSKKHSIAVDAVLRALDRQTADLETNADISKHGGDMCGVRYMAVPRQVSGGKVSHEGAELVALAIEKLHLGDDPLLVLEATAFNLGLRSFGEPGSRTSYDPMIHEDIVGGIKPGAEVQFTRKGWKRDNRVITRAKVKLPPA